MSRVRSALLEDYVNDLNAQKRQQMARSEAINAANRKPVVDALMQTWPVQAAKAAYRGFTLPGDVYAGRAHSTDPDFNERVFDLAGSVTLGAGAMPAAKNSLRSGIKAYHGSPHDFDKFSLDKIGTGEGAQAYGHGLYFADNEAVAKGYRDTLSKSGNDGAIRRLQRANGDIDEAIKQARVKADRYRQGGADGYADAVEEDLRFLEKFKETGEWSNGRMYEVEINANPDDFLDWDKPLSEQSEAVKGKATSLFGPKFGQDITGQEVLKRVSGFDEMVNVARKSQDKEMFKMVFPEASEDQIRYAFTMAERADTGPDMARQILNQAGILGIKYLDAGSRAAGEGSRNYVVFDDSLIKIMRKYGIAVPAGMAGYQMTQDQFDEYVNSGGQSMGGNMKPMGSL